MWFDTVSERGCDDKAAQTVVMYTFSSQQQKQMKGWWGSLEK